MSKLEQITSSEVSRRSFLQGMAVAGGTIALAGCATGAGSSVSTMTSMSDDGPKDIKRIYGSSGHNCGGRCISMAEVSEGRIIRILTDESTHTKNGELLDVNSRNWPQTRVCTKCRAYKYRLYHPGRLLYPLKQTKKRGDLSGFMRISWEQAYKEIAMKHKAVIDKYGVDGVYQIYACGSVSTQLNGSQSGPIGKTNGYAIRLMDGVITPMFASYSRHQDHYFSVEYTGMDGRFFSPNDLAKNTKTLVMWGDNSMTTANATVYGTVRAVEEMKARDKDSKVVFIGPSFSDTGVTVADQWYVTKPYTDTALIAGMIYHMLDNTFDLSTGELKKNPWLDLDYIDSLVYGFFDSPQYAITEETGAIGKTGDRLVYAVPAGRSYASWVLGNNKNAKTYASLGAKRTYTAKQYASIEKNAKRWAPCSYDKNAGSKTIYKTKQEFMTPKTPAWASKITGISEASIKQLAEMFAKDGPINSRWSGGQQKQMDGISNLFAMQILHIITKNVGKPGTGYIWLPFKSVALDKASAISANYAVKMPEGMPLGKKAAASCTAWHTAIKMAYADELKAGGYDAKYIPNFKQGTEHTDNVYWDDGGTKTFIQWRRDEKGELKTYTDNMGNVFYDWEGRTGKSGTATAHNGTPIMSGIRLLYNAGGNIFMNQHENSNDSRQMLESLKLNDYKNADSFCMVSIDNFMSPTPRWSDYVLPATTFWEQDDMVNVFNSTPFYMPKAIDGPGETKTSFDIGKELLETYADLTDRPELAKQYYSGAKGATSVEGIVKERFEEKQAQNLKPYTEMTWEQYKENPIIPAKPNDEVIPAHKAANVMTAYEGMSKADLLNYPIIKGKTVIATNEINKGGYGNDFCTTKGAPKSSLRFHAYSDVLTWQYVNRFSKFHGYLPKSSWGQQHTDLEGDRFVLEIPVYYAYQDTFMEAYGGKDAIKDLNFLLTTTHNRHRVHSSVAENPLLRELSHRVPGVDDDGMLKQANDYNYYGMAPSPEFKEGGKGNYPTSNMTINADASVDEKYKEIASYSEIWINDIDGKELGLTDGDLVQVENPVGAVRCVAKLTSRCARGYVDLTQGCWYDPREVNGKTIDVGGNCNTLMASQPSRIDHGNGQQSAMVKVTKVNNY